MQKKEKQICKGCNELKDLTDKNYDFYVSPKGIKRYRLICRACVNKRRKSKYVSTKKVKKKTETTIKNKTQLTIDDYKDITPEKVKEYFRKTQSQKLKGK